ncbi:MAG: NYN domain-containing protein [Dehalococcoidia bacterium]
MTQNQTQKRLAVLIDADNAQPAILDGLIAEIAKYGVSSVKRAYGDWTNPKLKGWKDVLLEYAIHPIQQFEYTTGKNATDSAMLIDAMDLLYTDKFEGFCIVSSDSDFTRLASRVREAGLLVLGFGEKKTPKPFVNACDKFIYTEILRSKDETAAVPQKRKMSAAKLRSDTKLVTLLRGAVENAAGESGWAYLGNVGHSISNQSPEFDPRNYGYAKLGELIRATGLFEISERSADNSPAKSVYVRDKRKKSVA